MSWLLCFLGGFICAVVLFVALRARESSETPPRPRTVTKIVKTVVQPVVAGDTTEMETFAGTIGIELANLSSGIEGRAHLLCDAIGMPQRVAEQGDKLCTAVRRLRFFSEKILSFTHGKRLRQRPTDVRGVLQGLKYELEHHVGGIQVELTTASALPRAQADVDALGYAILFLVDATLDLEPDAAVLSLRASTEFDDETASGIQIEIQAEHGETGSTKRRREPDGPKLSFLAAKNLLNAHGAELKLEHWPGQRAHACFTLRIAALGEKEQFETAPEPMPPHPYGGVLILETDPSVRSMLSEEVTRSGRNVVTCADGLAARTLFHATPERFEVLILDGDARRESGESLAKTALEKVPDAKVLLLGNSGTFTHQLPAAQRRRFRELPKPFGLIELRESMSELLRVPVRAPLAG